MGDDKFHIHKEYPKSCPPTDFWSQVKRTVDGIPVSEAQIQMIVDAILKGLLFEPEDQLLDLCCGNGALTDRLLKYCSASLGVDFSEYLIEVAKTNFEKRPQQEYILQDVVSFCQQHIATERFTKALCYGAFSYLDNENARKLLTALSVNFENITRVFIGNYPDLDKIFNFYSTEHYYPGIETKADSAIGIWRSKEEFSELATQCGWHAEFTKMPEHYYAAHYRYDVVLTRLGCT
ncbi:class I SAM-dependent methyltransferase [Rheinheimera metallidurans]|uniref:class I SAM-dependent methyltransferase n=1 Tax=Rheinheimera metallidurans TaxID=2925781 RepID=UPI003001FC9F